MPAVPSRRRRRFCVLSALRQFADHGEGPGSSRRGGRRSSRRHRAVRGLVRLHRDLRAARSRGRACAADRPVRCVARRGRALRRLRREVRRRRGDGGLRRAGGARGRPPARLARGPRDARLRRAPRRTLARSARPRPRPARRRQFRPGCGWASRLFGGRCLCRDRRHREHGRAPAGRGRGGSDAGEPGNVRAGAARVRVRVPRHAGVEGQGRGLAGLPAARGPSSGPSPCAAWRRTALRLR